jgi:hypothetical protein
MGRDWMGPNNVVRVWDNLEPDMRPANAQSAWAGLNERLNHPVVERALATK